MGWGWGTQELEKLRVGTGVRRAEESHRYWVSLEASMLCDVQIGTTGSHLPLLTVKRNVSFGRGKLVPELGGVEFSLDLARSLGLIARAFTH